jgi:pimeloyl-ACP methyl ester carboxylesterase
MEKVDLGSVQLEHESRGSGEPVVLIHGGAIADTYAPIMEEPALAGFRLLRYRRRGFGGSTHSDPPVSIRRCADDCLALMRHLGIARAHLAGHSYGGIIALQLALDHPETVGSIALLEPALVAFVPDAAAFNDGVGSVVKRYIDGDKAGALDGFLSAVGGPNPRGILDRVPGAYQMALADVDYLFRVELAELPNWHFTRDDAARIKQPLLAMVGSESRPVFQEIHTLAQSWFRQCEPVTIAGANHMLPMMMPRPIAEALASFFRRNPLR